MGPFNQVVERNVFYILYAVVALDATTVRLGNVLEMITCNK